jgi:ribosomal protein S12 methylthiotransferase accessory factor
LLNRASGEDLSNEGHKWLAPPEVGLVRASGWTSGTELEWLPFRDLGDNDRPVFVPAEYAIVPYIPASGPRLTASSSDGIAAGNTFDEAALHALMELIERDACSFGVWMHRGWRVAMSSLPDTARSLVSVLEAADLDVTIYQFDAALGVPVVYVTLDDRRTANSMLLCAGAGAHLDGDVALTRALTEAAQSRVCAISGGREDLAPKYLDNRRLGYGHARASLDAWDLKFTEAPYRRWGAVRDLQSADRTLRAVVERLRELGMPRVLVRELTPAGQPLSVVSAVVPGLECVEGPASPAGPRFRSAMLQHAGPAGVALRTEETR